MSNRNNEALAKHVKDNQPNMVDEFGTKWFLDPGGSNYASMPDKHGIALKDATVWVIEELNGSIRMCLVQHQKVIYENFYVQQIGQEIDKLKAQARANSLRGIK